MPFDFTSYEAKCSTMTVAQLQHEWEKYTRLISSAAMSTTISSSTFLLTLGTSGIGIMFSAPAIHNARKKRDIIDHHMTTRFGVKPRTRKRDVISALTLSAGVNGVTMGIGNIGCSELINEALNEGWAEIVAHQTAVQGTSAVLESTAGMLYEDKHEKRKENKKK